MTNLEKLQKIANFRIDVSVDVKFDNGDIEHHEYETIRDLFSEYFTEIEHALKRAEELEIENSKQFKEKLVQDNLAMTFELNVANRKLKALDIIKEKRVDIAILLESESLYDYNDYMNSNDIYNEYGNSRQLTKEEYDLLNEILK